MFGEILSSKILELSSLLLDISELISLCPFAKSYAKSQI